MAANKSQGSYYTLFLVASTVLCAGILFLSAAWESCCCWWGRSALLGSLFGMMKIKPLEGKTAMKPGPMR